MAARESRPAGNEAAGSLTDHHKSTARLPVYGRVRVDLGGMEDDEIRRSIRSLSFAQPTHVVVSVGRRQYPPHHDVRMLADSGHLASVVIEGDDPTIVGHWMSAFRGEDPFDVL